MNETQALVGFLILVAFGIGVVGTTWVRDNRLDRAKEQLALTQHQLAKANERAAEATVAAATARAQVEWHGGRR